jgi:hypothetical protein
MSARVADYDSFDGNRIKHMEMIQAVVGRLAGNSFLIKGWAITLAGVFFGFAVKDLAWDLALAGFLPTLAFWIVDAYFLRSERLFRALYDQVGTFDDEHIQPFFMGATGDEFVGRVSRGETLAERSVASWKSTFWRPTLRWFYLSLMVANGLIILLILVRSDASEEDWHHALHGATRLTNTIGNALQIYPG